MPKQKASPVESVNKKKGNRQRRQQNKKKVGARRRKNLKSYNPVPSEYRIERAWRNIITQIGAPTKLDHGNGTANQIPAVYGAWPTMVQSGQASWESPNLEVVKRYSSGAKTSIASQKCNVQKPKDFWKMPPELQEDPNMWKYWKKRTYLFSRHDEGIIMDKESWYSVTPEPIARRIAERRQYNIILDAFCGAGGNTIQFAMNCAKKVLAIDIDPIKIKCARHNANIYGVADRIEFIKGDFFKLAPFLKADMVFLSPPWGGPDYQKDILFDIETLQPEPASELLRVARTISNSATLYLPKNSKREQIQSLANEHDILETEDMMGGPTCQGTAFQAIVAYYDFCDKSIPLQMAV